MQIGFMWLCRFFFFFFNLLFLCAYYLLFTDGGDLGQVLGGKKMHWNKG